MIVVRLSDNLYYFGRYYDKEKFSKMDKVTSLKGEDLMKKNKLIKIYNDNNLEEYRHMFPIEEWVKKEDF